MSLIPFDDITPDASVRFTWIEQTQYISVRDLIMVMCDQNNDRAGKTWRNFDEARKQELASSLKVYKFPGQGQQEMAVISFKGAIKLLMWLPGEKAKIFRSKAADILTRYYAGDKTLLRDVAANAESSAPVNVFARAALEPTQEQLEEDAALERKRKRIEMDREELDNRLKCWELQRSYMENCQKYSRGGELDERTKLMFKDCILNLSAELCGVSRPAICDGSGGAKSPDGTSGAKSPDAPLTISTVAAAKGLRLSKEQLVAVGVKMSGLYRQRHGQAPPKHEQFVDGAVRQVCSYSERDRDLLEQALLTVDSSE
jgi:hypothetical protein